MVINQTLFSKTPHIPRIFHPLQINESPCFCKGLLWSNQWQGLCNTPPPHTHTLPLGWKPPGLPVTSSFPREHRALLRVKHHGSPGHNKGLSLGPCHLPFEMGLFLIEIPAPGTPPGAESASAQSQVYYLTGTRLACSLRTTWSWCSSVRCPWRHVLSSPRTSQDMEAGELSASPSPHINRTHLPLAKALEQRHTFDSSCCLTLHRACRKITCLLPLLRSSREAAREAEWPQLPG